jgi:hypothetical protein
VAKLFLSLNSAISVPYSTFRIGLFWISAIALINVIAAPTSAQEIAPAPSQQVTFGDRETFDNRGIQFDVDTVVEFEFLEAHGAYQSVFGVINLATGEKTPLIQETKPSDLPQSPIAPSTFANDAGSNVDFLSTPGNAVPQPLAEFDFKANTPYALYLESFYNGRSEQVFYSIDSRNPSNMQRVQFKSPIQSLVDGGVTVDWDDTGSLLVMSPEEDQDFDDFIVRAGGHVACVQAPVTDQKQRQSAMPTGTPTGAPEALTASARSISCRSPY